MARASYGRLLAILTARTRDVSAAEDALADAFRKALELWPSKGIPQNPEAWLLTASRRSLIDEQRHLQVQRAAQSELVRSLEEAQELADQPAGLPDDRLKLLFVCAHPDIEPSVRTPLMLQVALGLDATRIASAFLIKPAAMGQRLSRAKAHIRDSGIPFEVPPADQLPRRLAEVLEAIYAAYGIGWQEVFGGESGCGEFTSEAIDLGRLLVQLLPNEPEALGLTSLMLHCEARRNARRGENGAYIPLTEQEPKRWNAALIEEAEALLREAAGTSRAGRFQLEAAIQSAHAERQLTGRTDWEAIALLYEGLVQVLPTMGALIGRAAAVGEARGPEAAWTLLGSIPEFTVVSYQPYWALRAHLLEELGRSADARTAYERAIGLCEDRSVRDFLRARSSQLRSA